jgi:hypothetical protein
MECFVATFANEEGRTVMLPLYAHDGQWKTFGSYQVFGVSKSDPSYSAVHALPYKWGPKGRLLQALRKAK